MAGKSVNKVILIGNLGKDPEVKYTQGGMPVAKFSLATNERFKDKEGHWQDRTEWHNIVAFQRLAEIVGEYLKKGGKCFIEGSLRTSSWDDKETGQKKYKTEIIANDSGPAQRTRRRRRRRFWRTLPRRSRWRKQFRSAHPRAGTRSSLNAHQRRRYSVLGLGI